jgi:hypothetical protein
VVEFRTVRDLIELLRDLPQHLPVALSSDEEGNNFRMVNNVGVQHVEALEYQNMQTIHPDDLPEYDSWFKIAEIW